MRHNNQKSYNMQKKENEFYAKREQFAQTIRRNNREQIFAKRRNIDEEKDSDQSGNESKKNIVVDNRFAHKVEEFNKMKFDRTQFIELVQAIYDPDVDKQLFGIMGIRKLLSNKDNQPIQQVIDAGLVPRFFEYAHQKDYPQMQLESVWCLSNVASGTNDQCRTVIEKGGIKVFVDLLLSEHPGIIEQAVWTLGNIACDTANLRDSILKIGGLKNIITVIEVALQQMPKTPTMRTLIETSVWTLSTLCRNFPLPKNSVIKDAFPVFYYVLKNNLIKDIKIVGNVCWALSYYVNRTIESEKSINKIEQCINSEVVPIIVSYCDHAYDSLVVACIRIIGNISAGTNEQVQYLLSFNILDSLQRALFRNQKTIRKEACWALSNITAGSKEIIAQVFGKVDLVKKIVQLATTDLPEIRCECLYTLTNATENGDTESLVSFYREIEIIRVIGDILKEQKDVKLLQCALECLDYILLIGGSKKVSNEAKANIFVGEVFSQNLDQVLEEMQNHEENSIYDRVSKILFNYFELQNPLL